MSIIGHKGIQVLSNINSSDDLPEAADVESEAVWYIESGDLAPDYIAPSLWDGQQFNNWISLVDGEVLAGIPDSVKYHFYTGDISADDGESPDVWPETIQGADGDLFGPTYQVDGVFDGHDGLESDGVDDYADLGTLGNFGEKRSEGFSLVLTFRTTTDDGFPIAVEPEDGEDAFNVLYGGDSGTGYGTDEQTLRWVGGDGSNEWRIATDDGAVPTNETIAAIFVSESNSAEDASWYINESDAQSNVARDDGDLSNAPAFNIPFYAFARNDDGSDADHVECTIYEIMFADEPFDSADRQMIWDRYSWL